MARRSAGWPQPAAVTRLNALAPLDEHARAAIDGAMQRPRRHHARQEIVAEGEAIASPLLVLAGWAGHQCILEDGRRQIIDILLPGDLIGLDDYPRPVAAYSVVALTDVDICAAPARDASPALARAYAVARARREAGLAAQVVRIGRMSSHDRILDLFLELHERLELAGLAIDGGFTMPLTQEMIADAIGLTAVHVNRVLQTLRGDGAIVLEGRRLVLVTPDALRRLVGRRAATR